MRKVNETFGLPNPTPWHVTAAKKIKSVLGWLVRFSESNKRGVNRVGQAYASFYSRVLQAEILQQPTLESQKTNHRPELEPWTMEHGFYALMGGLAIHISDRVPKTVRFAPPGSNEYWSVTLYGLIFVLLRDEGRDGLPNLPGEEVMAKSKANGLAKPLVCLQALWFIAQCLTRSMF